MKIWIKSQDKFIEIKELSIEVNSKEEISMISDFLFSLKEKMAKGTWEEFDHEHFIDSSFFKKGMPDIVIARGRQ